MIMPILIGLAVVVVVFVIVVAMRPEDFRVTRSAIISAPPPTVFEQVNDFHKWDDWSPWAKLDPTCKNTFDGAPAGKGAKFVFKPKGNETEITWNMFGKNNFMSKAFGLFVNCDKMIGKDFEKGLASLKALTEAKK